MNELNSIIRHRQIPGVAFYGDPDKSHGWPCQDAKTILDALTLAKEWGLNAFHYYPNIQHMYPCKAITGYATRSAEEPCIGVIMEKESD